jgi:hypothetical protein
MKTKTLTPLFAILILFATACGSPSQSLHTGQVILKPGESVVDAAHGIEIIFVKILEDSRCPMGMLCIRAGDVQVQLEIRQGTESFQYTLALGDLSDGSLNTITVEGYQIALNQVTPFPQISQTIDPAKYEISLDVQVK